MRLLGSTAQPLDPETFHAVTKSLQTFHIAADTVVSEAPLDLASQHPILLNDWQMPIPATPPRVAFQASLEAHLRRLPLDDQTVSTRFSPTMGESQEIELYSLVSKQLAL